MTDSGRSGLAGSGRGRGGLDLWGSGIRVNCGTRSGRMARWGVVVRKDKHGEGRAFSVADGCDYE